MDVSAAINGDLSRRVAVDTAAMDWSPSPSATVWRKRLHLVGPPEAGQVTSIVRYLPGATFPPHDHPEGEEIFVLEGIFSDEHGDWPAGAYLLNPEGFRHAPFSKDGCVIFVKLRQFANRQGGSVSGIARQHVALRTDAVPWQPGPERGIEIKVLYANADFPDAARLERWAPGAGPLNRAYPGGAEILVLDGALRDDAGAYEKHGWLRLPAGASHRPFSPAGCTLYVKTGALPELRQATAA
jgi:anti-sigma factor ChrR (cupin superfamily)